MKKDSTSAAVGRPRAFDPHVALEKAMRVFWEKGYEGTSLTDLTDAMGINRPSLYAAFGNKEELFLKVLDRYGSGPASYALKALKEPTARAVIEKLLRASVDLLSDPATPRGCMAVQSVLCSSDAAATVREAARCSRTAMEAKMRERFDQARKEGDLPATVEPEDLARYVAMLLNGLSVQATNGASQAEMKQTVEFILKALPL